VLSQLGTKIQHALRPFTPNDQKAIRAVAASLRSNPEFNSETAISELAKGEALISALDESGAPEMVQRGFIFPLRCGGDVADPAFVQELTQNSPLYAKYAEPYDRYSAYEMLEDMAHEVEHQMELDAQEAQLQKEMAQRQKELDAQEAQRLKEQKAFEAQQLKEQKAIEAQQLKDQKALEAQRQRDLKALEAQRLKERDALQKRQAASAAAASKARTQTTKTPAKTQTRAPAKSSTSTAFDKALQSSMSQFGRSVSRELARGLFGTMKK